MSQDVRHSWYVCQQHVVSDLFGALCLRSSGFDFSLSQHVRSLKCFGFMSQDLSL